MAERESKADEVLAQTGGTLVHPYNDPDVMAGQGTMALGDLIYMFMKSDGFIHQKTVNFSLKLLYFSLKLLCLRAAGADGRIRITRCDCTYSGQH